jgi:CheY-like chemotaxis protein
MSRTNRILIVDDNAAALAAAVRLFARAGYDVLEAVNGAEALRLTLAHHPDLILLDVVLPDIDGTEILRRIKADPDLGRHDQAIIKSHGGFIRVYSEPGRGTTFKVYLPTLAVSEAEAVSVPEADLPRGHGEVVLVVDDEASIRQITRQTLEAFGYRVMLAGEGTEALALYAQHRQDIAVVVMDMMMPVLDGPSTIRALLRMDPGVRIVAASGITSNGGIASALGGGVKHFLPKPYTAEAILKVLQDILAGRD